MSAQRIALVDDPRFLLHRDAGHPERPERLLAARKGLTAALDERSLLRLPTRLATDAELERVHGAAMLRAVRNALAQGHGNFDADTYFCPETEEAAWLAAGSSVALAQALLGGDARLGVALARPPGHHAEADHPMGFCVLNNIAIAAAGALAAGARKVAIVDWDVHHGNGTQHAFDADPRVLFVSLHQFPLYPGTGRSDEIGSGDGRGTTCNLALPADQGPETYAYAFQRVVLPLLDGFGADIVLVSAGFDAHARDPLASMRLDAATYGAMTTALLDHVARAGHGRLMLVLEGGYDLVALEQSLTAVGCALGGQRVPFTEAPPSDAGRFAVERTRRALEPLARFDDDAAGA